MAHMVDVGFEEYKNWEVVETAALGRREADIH
jgi:hypothetical protein